MLRMGISLALVLGLQLASGARGGPVFAQQASEVEVELDPKRDFSLVTSYDWMESQVPAENLANHVRLTRAIQKELEAVEVEADTIRPSVRIRYVLTIQKKFPVRSTPGSSSWDPTNRRTDVKLGRYEEARLSIEMVDAETNALVWRATRAQPLSTPDKIEKQIQEVVARIFEKYPTKKEKP